MNGADFKTSLAVLSSAFYLALVAPAGIALAHTQDGSLGAGATATDYFQITCSDDGSGPPGSLVFQIEIRGPSASPLSMLAQRGINAISSTDTTPGDSTYSPLVSVNGGGGSYNVFIFKAAAGGVNYSYEYHCMTGPDGTGLHTGTSILFRQNQ